MKNKIIFLVFILLLLISSLSGCQDIFNIDGSTIYEKHPNSVTYSISYGYEINCTGNGKYSIFYKCDLPEVLIGNIWDIIIFNNDYYDETIATWNTVKSWNITSSRDAEYNLGISAKVRSDSFIVSDLNGKNALSIQQITKLYPEISSQYTKAQSSDTTIFINPNDPNINAISHQVFEKLGKNNSFLVAKELFKWLKENTDYTTHFGYDNVQTASYTLQCRTGDCDDLSFLYISFCRSLKIPSRFVRGFLVDKNNAIPHAWAEVFVGGNLGDNGWIPVECAGISNSIESEIHQNFGIEDVGHLRLFKDDGSNESLNVSISGLYYKVYNSRVIEATTYSNISDYNALRQQKLVINDNNKRTYE
jgi:hypothetical protein